MDLHTLLWIILVFVVAPTFSILCTIADYGGQEQRIRSFITSRGGRLLSIQKKRWGQGFFSHTSSRTYEVVYLDQEGEKHQADFASSLFYGTTWRNDVILHTQTTDSLSMLRQANKRLRREIQHLERSNAFEVETLQRQNEKLRSEIASFGG